MPTASCFLRSYEQEVSKHTDAPKMYHRGCALTVLGALLTRQHSRCVLHFGEGGIWTNLWVVLLGAQGESRKSFSIKVARKVLRAVDATLIGPNDMSPEGLVGLLHERDLAEENPSTLLVFSEFLHLLHQFRRQYSTTLRTLLLTLYDVDDSFTRQLRKSTIELRYPRASLLGGIPEEMLAEHGQPEDWTGGLYNRCIFIVGKKEKEQKLLPQLPDNFYDKQAAQLNALVGHWISAQEKRQFAQFKLSPEARKIQSELKTSHDEPHIAEMLTRASTHFAKIAAIEQVDEDPEAPCVMRPAAERARDFLAIWQGEMPRLVSLCRTTSRADFEGDKMPKRIMRFLEKMPGHAAVYSDLLNGCGLAHRQLDDALTTLTHAKKLQVVSGDEGETSYILKGSSKK